MSRDAVPATRRIVVVHLLHTIAYGGVETAIINWLRKLDPTRFDAHMVVFANPGETERPFAEAAERAGIAVRKIPWSRAKPVFRATRAMAALMRETGADIVHTHNVYADLVGLLAARRTGARSVTTGYVWADLGWWRNLLQLIDRYVMARFDLITAHCEDTGRRMAALNITRRDIPVLICGFESDRVEIAAEERIARRRALGIGDGDILLANIARLHPEKNQAFLLRCFARIHARMPQARLWILGVGSLEAELKALSSELGLDDAVRFPGFVDNLAAFLPLVDVQVHPSFIEGVALAICSGMAAGLPIVATDVGGLSEVLRSDRTGVLVPYGDADAFVEAVVRLIENPDEGRRLGAAARHFIENDYALDTAVGLLERTYRELVGQCA